VEDLPTDEAVREFDRLATEIVAKYSSIYPELERLSSKFMRQLKDVTKDAIDEQEKVTDQALLDLEKYRKKMDEVVEGFKGAEMGDIFRIGWEEALTLTGALDDLVDQLNDLEAAGKITREEVNALAADFERAYAEAIQSPTVEQAHKVFVDRIHEIVDALGLEIPAALEITEKSLGQDFYSTLLKFTKSAQNAEG